MAQETKSNIPRRYNHAHGVLTQARRRAGERYTSTDPKVAKALRDLYALAESPDLIGRTALLRGKTKCTVKHYFWGDYTVVVDGGRTLVVGAEKVVFTQV